MPWRARLADRQRALPVQVAVVVEVRDLGDAAEVLPGGDLGEEEEGGLEPEDVLHLLRGEQHVPAVGPGLAAHPGQATQLPKTDHKIRS